ncbi:phage minor tail protein L [Methylobacterium nodulans]|uniref:Phage minor tail protein L n=1 Tax=Methylobacterium nodulans (strain LMG 21967 / CNCM I-2342 / ORS 2060) TaxID=460265 RepID=B8IAI7_METNO|nr:phage minor tail protein L [Methylobacterium nodulans]ACL61032.1 phage minor tail protein L [Methylobacterium nodulans ORS 2060]
MTAPNTALIRAGQSLTPGDLVALFIIDLSPIRVNQQFAFTSQADKARGPLKFRGITYTPLDVKAEGFELTGQGTMPQPKISVSNATRLMSSATLLYQDLIGAKLIRTRTYAQFLDDGATPDPEAAYTQDIYRFEQKVEHSKHQIVWNLAADMDQEGRELPARLVIRDICLWRYRRWDEDAQAFVYDGVQCLYNGDQSYDRFGNPTTPDQDEPSRHVTTCCKVRFGADAQLPFGGFPGVARVRV